VTQYFQSFVGEPLNSSPQGWVSPNAPVGGPNGKYRIALNSTRGINLLTVAYGVGSFGYTLYYPEISYKNPDIIEFFIKIDTTIISNYPSFLRFFFDTSYNTGIDIAISSTNFKLNKVINGISTNIVNYAYTFSNNSIYYIRARCNWPNRFVQAKVWDNDVTTEPISWHIESVVNDTGITIKGYSGIGYPGDGFWVHYIGIGTNGDSAPIGPVPFPEVKGVKTLEVPQKVLREPRLLLPGLQPVGKVKIDWTNPITRQLVFCFVVPNFVNLVDGAVGASVNDPITITTGPKGKHMLGTTNTQGIQFPVRTLMTSASWSALSVNNPYNAAQYANGIYFSNFNTFGNNYTWNIGPGVGKSNYQAWGLTGGDQSICSFSEVENKMTTTGMQLGSGITNGTQFWYDGKKKNTVTCTQSTLTSGAALTLLYFYPSASPLYRFHQDQQFAASFIWDRRITDAEMYSMSRNPYQILAPA